MKKIRPKLTKALNDRPWWWLSVPEGYEIWLDGRNLYGGNHCIEVKRVEKDDKNRDSF